MNTYETYIESAQWDEKRRERLEMDNYTCQSCGCKDKPLDVHHKTYERLGKERMDDLESLCRRCHDIEHGKRPSIIFDTCQTCGRFLPISMREIKIMGALWTEYTCADGHIRSYKKK